MKKTQGRPEGKTTQANTLGTILREAPKKQITILNIFV